MNKSQIRLRRFVASAMFLSVSLVLRTFFSFYIPIFGEAGLRVGIHGIFAIMPAILFGPIYGMFVAGLSDLLGHFIRPSGAWIPYITLVATLGGLMRGLIWKALCDKDVRIMRGVVTASVVIFLAFGTINTAIFRIDNLRANFFESLDSEYMTMLWDSFEESDSRRESALYNYQYETLGVSDLNIMSRIVVTRSLIPVTSNIDVLNERLVTGSDSISANTRVFTVVPMGIAAFGFVLLVFDLVLSQKMEKKNCIFPLIFSITLSAAFINTLNTVILRQVLFTSWQELSFFVVWLPRILPALVIASVNVYIAVFLYNLALKQKYMQSIIYKSKETEV